MMPIWLQHFLVLLAVAAAATILLRQAVATFRAGKGGFGSCCAKGCASQPQPPRDARPTQRVVFLPVDSLTIRRK